MAAKKTPNDSALLAQKRAWLAELLADEQRALADMEEAAESARAAAAHAEMKPENDKDTRALEAGYLASGQSVRAAAIRRAVAELKALAPRAFAAGDPVDAGALVEVTDTEDEKRTRYFVAPSGGGKRFGSGAGAVLVITPSSPLGDALVGKRAGALVEVTLGGRARELEVLSVS